MAPYWILHVHGPWKLQEVNFCYIRGYCSQPYSPFNQKYTHVPNLHHMVYCYPAEERMYFLTHNMVYKLLPHVWCLQILSIKNNPLTWNGDSLYKAENLALASPMLRFNCLILFPLLSPLCPLFSSSWTHM